MKKIKIISFFVGVLTISFILNSLVNNVFALNKDVKVEQTSEEKSVENIEVIDDEDIESEYVVVLDAGHGGYDPGSTSYDEVYLEKDISLDITLQLGEMLEAEGVNVIYTRDSDEVSWNSNNLDDLASRVAISNENNTALFVSLHLNYYDTSDVYGFETWVDYSDESAVAFAQLVQEQLATLNYSYNRGLKDESESPLYVISNNQATSVLIELGFITANNDLNYLVSEEGSTNTAQALNSAIITYLTNNNYLS